MTTDNWLTIAQIISTLIAALVGKKLLLRIRKAPTPTPETKQPKKRIQIIADWIADKPKGFWLWFIGLIAFGIFNVVWVFRDQRPVDRSEIMRIVLSLLLLVFLFLTLFVVLILDFALSAMFRIHQDGLRETRNWMKDITEALAKVPGQPQSRFDRIIDNLKKLLR